MRAFFATKHSLVYRIGKTPPGQSAGTTCHRKQHILVIRDRRLTFFPARQCELHSAKTAAQSGGL